MTEEENIAIKYRHNFSNFFRNIVEETNINKLIREKIISLNSFDNICAHIYGGNMWNYNTQKLLEIDNQMELTKLQESSVLSGGYDVFICSDERNYEDVYNDIINLSQHIFELFNEYFLQTEYSKYYSLQILKCAPDNTEKNENCDIDIYKSTIAENARGIFISLFRKRSKYEPSTLEKIIPKNLENKTLFYFEIGNNSIFREISPNVIERQIYLDIQNYKRTFISHNSDELNMIGFFLIPNFIIRNRIGEKGIPVDNIRMDLYEIYFKKIILYCLNNECINDNNNYIYTKEFINNVNNYINQFNENEIINISQNMIFSIIYEIFPTIFIDNSQFYMQIKTNILQKYFAKYNAYVYSEYSSENILFKDFFDEFNEKFLLNKPVNTRGVLYPSLRQIINILFSEIYLNLPSNQCIIESGGDALRHFIPEYITKTSDIDAKLFYTEFRLTREKIILILFFLNQFMITNHYFRIDETYDVYFANRVFKINLNSQNQDIITSIRVLYDFDVPLISIDGRIKYKIIYENIIFTDYYRFTPLDIAFNKKTSSELYEICSNVHSYYITNDELNANNNIIINKLNEISDIEYINPFIRMTNYEENLFLSGNYDIENNITILPPTSLKYLRNDLIFNTTDIIKKEERKISGKHEKDKSRLNNLHNKINSLINSNLESYKQLGYNYLEKNIIGTNLIQNNTMFILEQLYPINNIEIYNDIKNLIKTIMSFSSIKFQEYFIKYMQRDNINDIYFDETYIYFLNNLNNFLNKYISSTTIYNLQYILIYYCDFLYNLKRNRRMRTYYGQNDINNFIEEFINLKYKNKNLILFSKKISKEDERPNPNLEPINLITQIGGYKVKNQKKSRRHNSNTNVKKTRKKKKNKRIV
jgi:hypothetical protein